MQQAVILFTRRRWHPVSWLIRWALPVSRFKWARASHSMVLDGDHVIHATMLHGLVRQPLAEAMKSQVLVRRKDYEVPDLEAGLTWARQQAEDGRPYDFKGAFGVSLKPDRNWQHDDAWFCHEFCAAFLHACGRRMFDRFGHVTDTALLLMRSSLQ